MSPGQAFSRSLCLNLYIVKIQVPSGRRAVKQNLYSVKMTSYKDSYGKIIQRKQSEPSCGGTNPQAGKGGSRKAGRPAAQIDRRIPLSPRRPARGLAAGGRAVAGARRPAVADAAYSDAPGLRRQRR